VLLRVGRRTRSDRLTARLSCGVSLALATLACASASGCLAPPETSDGATLLWSVSPDPPRVGSAMISLRLTDAQAKPLSGVRWTIVGTMTHPGMPPVEAAVTDVGGGGYEARLTFSMAGDWVLIARASWKGGGLVRNLVVRVGS
jgi:hypothetical protein